jgi:hypothetical protein
MFIHGLHPDGKPGESLRSILISSGFVLLAVTLVTRFSGLVISFYSGDEATYSALSSRILEGALPYQGAVDHKPAGIVMLYVLIYGLVGRNKLIFLRILLMGVVAATGFTLGKLSERLSGSREARFAGLMYVLASVWGLPGDLQAANTELFLNLPLCLAGFLVAPAPAAGGRSGGIRFVAAGALTGIAGLFKYQASLAGAGWALAALWTPGGRLAKVGRLAALAAGFVLIALPYTGFFAWKGIWSSFTFWGWKYNFQYMSVLTSGEIAWNALRYTAFIGAVWAPLFICLRRASRPAHLLVLPWLTAMGLAIAAGGRFFPHYYLMILPPLCLLVSADVIKSGRLRSVFLVMICVYTAAAISLAWAWYGIKPDLSRYDRTYRAVGAWIRSHSGREDRIFVWGNSPEIYYYSDRLMGTRFPFCNYHTGRIWGTRFDDADAAGTESNIVPRAWLELMEDLRRSPPLYLVDAAAGRLDRFDLHPASRYSVLADYIASSCKPRATVEGVPIYQCAGRNLDENSK